MLVDKKIPASELRRRFVESACIVGRVHAASRSELVASAQTPCLVSLLRQLAWSSGGREQDPAVLQGPCEGGERGRERDHYG